MQSLPIDPFLPEILRTLEKSSSLVLSASPGAGKTTRLPPEILKLTDKAVWVLEPRRIAALSAPQRIAEERGWQLGRETGYQVRFENRSSRDTRLLFLTEALLMRKLLQDPELKSVGCVVLDEFHERSLHVDLALGALKELQELSRPDLKIVVMSATLNADRLRGFLGGCPLVEVPGKIFPLELRYEEKPQLLQTGPEFTDRFSRLVRRAATEQKEGDILCFLPGRGEIERLRSALEEWASGTGLALLPLHGQLNLQEQKAALEPMRKRKIILATNVAESSLTVEGVRTVVDSGLARISRIHPRTGFESLDLVRISLASATQRAGRSARLGPGTVYRAWMPFDERSMKEFETPEVLRTDLSESLLLLSALGITHAESFSWIEAPSPRSLCQARDLLLSLGAIGEDGALTPAGARIRELPVHPRLARLIQLGEEMGYGASACEIAALLSEPMGRLPVHPGAENDFWLRRGEWKKNPQRFRSVNRAVEQLRSLSGGEDRQKFDEDGAVRLLLAAYKDRLCRRRRPAEPQARMAGGRGVRLHQDSSVKNSEYFLALELAEGRDVSEALVFQAVGVPSVLIEKEILPEARLVTRPEWDEEKKRFFMTEAKEWNGLVIGREHRRPAESGEIGEALPELLLARWKDLLGQNENLAFFFSRLEALERMEPEWPVPGAEEKLEALRLASFGENSWEKIAGKNLVPFFEQQLGPDQRQALERECPPAWRVPSGSNLRIWYTEEQGPVVEVRLQELFGLKSQPRVAGQPLTLFLLAPNFRPVQVTKDLESFWKTAYPEVRKEMRARYPRHSWPEDPLTAPPQAKGRPRGVLK